ncbi:hypothetical protein [Thiomicrorhabdus sp.]|uniref:Outer membrane protein beta-barrel domain-containing protein n=2 Tax=Thiomicrorhabdus heinhorstiae TaxID=2748010 RepID=A0ABS0C3V4_9GAMM|nr:hypothetical protein [Thiomicrorhabdus sp.]MBF6058937.1 hypothetical protein [Thiomicrorhabdus heinhorstiae]
MKKILLILFISLFTLQAEAGERGTPFAVGAGYGTFAGPTVEVVYSFDRYLSFRGSFSTGMPLKQKNTEEEFDYFLESSGRINRLGLDYHPFANGLFFSVAYVRHNFKVSGNSSKEAGYSQNLATYSLLGIDLISVNATATEDLNAVGLVDWRKEGTMFSMGWAYGPERGWGLMFEIGAVLLNSPTVVLSGSGEINGTNINDSQDAQDAIKDEQAKVEADLSQYDFIPIIQAGVTYRF